MQKVEKKVVGNDEVVLGLKNILAQAEQGFMRACAVLCVDYKGANATFLGDTNARMEIHFGAELLQRAIMDQVMAVHKIGSQAPPANLLTYDLNQDPVCFDFIPWLVTQEMIRIRENAPAPLRIRFTANPSNMINRAELNAGFIKHVMKPALELFGAVEDTSNTTETRRAEFIGLRYIAIAARAGDQVPRIKVPEYAQQAMRAHLKGALPVTITLREAEYGESRNSNLAEWYKFAAWLSDRGEHVIIVRDTAKHNENFYAFETYSKAARHLHTRAALYAHAKCNCFVQNGPFGLACFGERPWLMFADVSEEAHEHFNTPVAWQHFMGINNIGDQLPWSTPQQRIIYKPDLFEHMKQAYEELGL